MEFQFVSSKLLGADLDFLAYNCPIFPSFFKINPLKITTKFI